MICLIDVLGIRDYNPINMKKPPIKTGLKTA